jgi:phage RecT family recombinase
MNRSLIPAALNAPAQILEQKLDLVVERASHVIPGDVFAQACMIELNNLTELLKPHELANELTIRSAITSVMNLAIIGLEPGKALGHAHLIPYYDKKKGAKLIQVVVGYKGFLELAYANDFLVQVDTEVILQGEECELIGTDDGPKLRHKIPIGERDFPTRENLVAAYCTYRTKGGGRGVVLVRRNEILKIAKGYLWNNPDVFPEMCKKTAVRRAAKLWRLSRRALQAVYLDEQQERQEEQITLDNELISKDNTKEPEALSLDDIQED